MITSFSFSLHVLTTLSEIRSAEDAFRSIRDSSVQLRSNYILEHDASSRDLIGGRCQRRGERARGMQGRGVTTYLTVFGF